MTKHAINVIFQNQTNLMKRTAIYLLIVISLFYCAPGEKNDLEQRKNNDLQRENLQGKVKSVKSKYYDPSYEIMKGEEVEERTKAPFYVTSITYDKQGNRVEYIGYPEGELKLTVKTKYSHSDDGKTSEASFYNETGTFISRTVERYNEQGHKIEGISYNSNGKVTVRITTKSTQDGNAVEYITEDFEQSSKRRSTRKYDKEGNLIEERHWGKDGFITTFKYDDEDYGGNYLKEIVYHDGNVTRIIKKEIEYYD
jgi:YD repeat-containing protein